ncbi:MAG TPA: polysaccharide biosynthesis/export family protein [bacterium]|nr:polysaccharide biosynthesis/export family protein [bacterium]
MPKTALAIVASVSVLLSGASAAAQTPYVLGPDDVLEITVYGHADLSRVVVVLPDGTVSVPLAGIIHVAGLTVEQATRKIADALAVYIRGPQVVVIVKEFRKVRISVLGQVMRPGTFELKPGATVLDALAAAGGLTEKASVTQARLVRASGETVPLRLDDLLLRQDMSRNLPLGAGDTLMIPEELNNKIYVLGDVNAPGVFVLREDVTLLQALAMAGGPAQRGYGTARSVHIVRRSATPPRVPRGVTVERMEGRGFLITADLQALLRDGAAAHDLTVTAGDIIVVPQSGLSGMQSVLAILAGVANLIR